MPGEKQASVKIVWNRVAVMERFSSVLYPLDILELLRSLPNIGYVVPELVLRGTPEQGKPLATKGDVELLINQDNKTIGVRARDTETAVSSFQELRKHYQEHLDPPPGIATHYLEFDGEGWARSRANPVEAFARYWAKCAQLGELTKILQADAVNYGLQLAPPRGPNDPNWFHVYIEPLVPSSNTRYRIRYIWRGTEGDELLVKFRQVDDVVSKLILKIESD